MQATIEISNINEGMLKAVKTMLKTQPEIRFKVKKEKTEYPEELLAEWAEIAKETERDYLAGKIKGYTDVDEMFEDIMND